jgi:hypothetical protein
MIKEQDVTLDMKTVLPLHIKDFGALINNISN